MKKVKTSPKDYLRLPFEIYYSGPLSYTSWELMSEEPKVSKPADIKGLRIEQGRAYGVSFYCKDNTGAELYCLMTGACEGATPNWLVMGDVDDLNINQRCKAQAFFGCFEMATLPARKHLTEIFH